MKKVASEPQSNAQNMKSAPTTASTENEKRLLAALETARENVKPTVKRLMESESVSNDLLSTRLESRDRDDSGHY